MNRSVSSVLRWQSTCSSRYVKSPLEYFPLQGSAAIKKPTTVLERICSLQKCVTAHLPNKFWIVIVMLVNYPLTHLLKAKLGK